MRIQERLEYILSKYFILEHFDNGYLYPCLLAAKKYAVHSFDPVTVGVRRWNL